jgi:arylsulfatase A-like enzyme
MGISKRTISWMGALGAATLLLGVLWILRPGHPESVILISIDALRADRLGCYGYSRETTPALDRVAAKGVLFEEASTTGSWTIPSHASLFTGLYPRAHGMRYANSRLPEDVVTLASVLGDNGFSTGAFVNVHLLSTTRGFSRGFDDYRNIPPASGPAGSVEQINREAIEWLGRHRDQPFFLFLHYYDVHSDYQVLPEYRAEFCGPYSGIATGGTDQLKRHRSGGITLDTQDAQHLSDLYDAGVRQFDDAMARFFVKLEAGGLFDRAILVIASDHGEEFFEHGDFLHSRTLYQELIHVQLIMAGPGLPEGLRIREPVSLVDVAPTIASLLGVGFPSNVDGVDLSGLWKGKIDGAAPRTIFADADLWAHNPEESHRRLLRRDNYTLHWDSSTDHYSLFDLNTDLGETKNIAERKPEIFLDHRAELMQYAESTRQAGPLPPPSPEEIQRLKQLGYID